MPRIKQYSDVYNENDFRRELYVQLTNRYEKVSIRALAAETGICQSVLNTNLRHNNKNLTVGVLQKVIPLLKPNPAVVLKLLGYTGDDIRKFKNA